MPRAAAEGLSLLLPVPGQTGDIARSLAMWSKCLQGIGREYEIILVDKRDSAFVKAATNAGNIPSLRVLELNQPSYGAALQAGLKAAKHPLIFITGCSYDYNPADLKRVLERITQVEPETGRKLDIVNGCRTGQPLTGWRSALSLMKRIFMRVVFAMQSAPNVGRLPSGFHRGSLLPRILFGLRIVDAESQFKLVRSAIFERFPIQSIGEFALTEILVKANFLGCLMDELPISMLPSRGGKGSPNKRDRSRASDIGRVFFDPVFYAKPNGAKLPNNLQA